VTTPSPTASRSPTPSVDLESWDYWQRHLGAIVESLAPEDGIERALAYRVANLLWRLHRVTRYEVAETNRRIASISGYGKENEATIRRREEVLLDDYGVGRITRYEAHLHRQFLQTLHELEAMQSRRRGDPAPLARLDVSAAPAARDLPG